MAPIVPTPLVVAIVDDFPVITLGVEALLKPFRHRVRVEKQAGPLPRRGRVDVVLYDPAETQNASRRLSRIAHETGAKVLVYAWTIGKAQLDDAMSAGAAGFLSKRADAAAMVSALEAVATRAIVVAEPTAQRPSVVWPGESEGLSARESVIVSLIVAGMSNRDIAGVTDLSLNVVNSHVRSAYRTMGVASRTQAVVWGTHHGFQLASPEVLSSDGAQR